MTWSLFVMLIIILAASGVYVVAREAQLRETAQDPGLSDEEARILPCTRQTKAPSTRRCPKCGHEFGQ